MCAIFQKKGQKNVWKGKKGQQIWKLWQKYTKFENILEKQVIACDYHTQTARKGPEYGMLWKREI